MIVRKAKLADVGIIVKLWEEFMKDHDKIILKSNPKVKFYLERKKRAPQIFKKYIRQQIKSKNAYLQIAEVDGKPAGYNLSKIEKEIPIFKAERLGVICDLFVRAPYRGKGISSKFKENALKWFKKRGIKQFKIIVHYGNKRAWGIYKKWGFIERHVDLRKRL